MRTNLKGIHKVKAKGRIYYYAWRGGPRLAGEPGSPEFVASYNEAVASHNAPDTSRFRGVVTAYRKSPDFAKLSPVTRKNWGPWLDRIDAYFGDLRIEQFNRTEKIQPVIRKWRYQWAATPRTADFAMQVLSRVCSFAIDPVGRIGRNPCEGIKRLYEGSDRAEIIWTDADIATLGKCAPLEVMDAVEFTALTGLRMSDGVRVAWANVGNDAIRIRTSKSRFKREAVIPLYPALRELLSRIDKRATTVLTNGKGHPWTAKRLDEAFRKARNKTGLDHHFHDLRGTAATKFYIAGIPERSIAEMLGWSEDEVKRIIRRYVAGTAATEAVIRQLST